MRPRLLAACLADEIINLLCVLIIFLAFVLTFRTVVLTMHSQHEENSDPIRKYIENQVHKVRGQLSMYREARRPVNRNKRVPNHSQTVRECEHDQSSFNLQDFRVERSIIVSEDRPDDQYQLTSKINHRDKSQEVVKCLQCEFKPDRDIRIEGNERLGCYCPNKKHNHPNFYSLLVFINLLNLRSDLVLRELLVLHLHFQLLKVIAQSGDNVSMANAEAQFCDSCELCHIDYNQIAVEVENQKNEFNSASSQRNQRHYVKHQDRCLPESILIYYVDLKVIDRKHKYGKVEDQAEYLEQVVMSASIKMKKAI